MIKRKQRIAMRDLGQLTGDDAETAAKNRIGGRDLNIFRVMMNHPDLTRRWTVFATISLPLIRPGIANAFLLGFIESIADFGNPLVLGGNFEVLST